MFMIRQHRSQLLLLFGLSSLLWTGCGGGTGTGTTPPKETKETKVTLKPVNKMELDEFIASQKGKVLLIDVWASW